MLEHLTSVDASENVGKLDLLHLDPMHPAGGCCGGHHGPTCCGRHRHTHEGPASAPNTVEELEAARKWE